MAPPLPGYRANHGAHDVLLDDFVLDRADALDLDANPVAGFQPRLSFHGRGDPGWRAGGDHVPRLKRARLRQDLDLPEAVEDELARVRLLAELAVDEGADVQRVRVAQLVGRGDPRADWPVRVEGLAQRPLRGLNLPVADADIIDDQVTGDHVRRMLRADVTTASADHEP